MRLVAGAFAAVAVIAISVLLLGPQSHDAGAGDGHVQYPCDDELVVTRNDGNHPVLWPASGAYQYMYIPAPAAAGAPQGFAGLTASLFGPSPVIDVHGAEGPTGDLNLLGNGTYAGFQTGVQFTGHATRDQSGLPTSLMGDYVVGGGGELPGGHPIIYSLTCTVRQPTPTPSPTPGPFSITVLSVNQWSGGPISGATVDLFANTNCTGTPVASSTSDGKGIVDFLGLAGGVFSVRQTAPDGFEAAVEGECQQANIGGALSAAPRSDGDCPVDPNQPFPDAGCDEFDSGAQVNVMLTNGQRATVTLNGPTLIQRGPVQQGGDGLEVVDTEIVLMMLEGDSTLGPITVRESASQDSNGEVREKENTTQDFDFPAQSFFDVFFEIDTDIGTLHNTQPLRMECEVDELPPVLCLYQPPIPDPIELYSEFGQLFGWIVHGLHVPLPAGEVLVVFTNSPALLTWGDWDCDGDLTAVDALAGQRYVATLSPLNQVEPCPDIGALIRFFKFGDADCDGDVDVVDALAALRKVAGLPVPPPTIRTGCYPLGQPVN